VHTSIVANPTTSEAFFHEDVDDLGGAVSGQDPHEIYALASG
jgi:hypothetical protein